MADVVDRPRVLRIHTSKSNSTTVRISIEDSGAGLPAENTARIFEPFFTKKSKGTGLGLAICRSIVESHGGLVSASRGKECGSIFQILLPIP
jgi:signal transduction histidine kinase